MADKDGAVAGTKIVAMKALVRIALPPPLRSSGEYRNPILQRTTERRDDLARRCQRLRQTRTAAQTAGDRKTSRDAQQRSMPPSHGESQWIEVCGRDEHLQLRALFAMGFGLSHPLKSQYI